MVLKVNFVLFSPLTAEELASKRAAILERLAEKKALALSQPVVDRDSSSDRENGIFIVSRHFLVENTYFPTEARNS